jgi:hypothetical protein
MKNQGAVPSGGFTGSNNTSEELTELVTEVTLTPNCRLLAVVLEKLSLPAPSAPFDTVSPIAITAPCPLNTKTPAVATTAFEFN